MVKIKKALRTRLENFLREYPSYEEYGGFLLESNKTKCVNDFILITNASDEPKRSYSVGKNRSRAKELAKKLAGSRRYRVIAFWHSHPTPCIMSAGDLSSSGSYYPNLVFMTISPTSEYGWKKKFMWYACKGVNPIEIQFV